MLVVGSRVLVLGVELGDFGCEDGCKIFFWFFSGGNVFVFGARVLILGFRVAMC